MSRTAAEWEARHRREAGCPLEEPSTILGELLSLLPAGPALDVACGTGRNTLYLAQRQPVTAVDRSPAALEVLEQRALARGQAVTRGAVPGAAAQGIHVVRCDLDEAQLPREAFHLIVCIRYLQRNLFRELGRALVPGGTLLFETYTKAQLAFPEGPKNPDYLLESGELRSAFPELRTLFYRELNAGQGIASLLARKPERFARS
jgi:tellurite methyltransferase